MPSRPQPPRDFVVLFLGRTGSTYLVHLLGQHPGIRADDEVFARIVDPDGQAQYLRELYGDSSPGLLSRGFKTKLEQVADPDAFATFLRDRGVAPILLGRRNVVKHAVSKLRVLELRRLAKERLGRPLSNLTAAMAERFDDVLSEPFRVEPDRLLSVVTSIEVGTDRLCDYISRNIGEPRLFHYEDLVADPDGTLRALYDHLGVPPSARREVDLVKMTDDDLRLVLANFSELADALAGTRHLPMLLDGAVAPG